MATSGEGNAKAAAVPPYLSYPTFQTFLSSLRAKGGAPGRIDRSVLVQFSGGVQTQLVSALRYLGLTSTDGIPTDDLDKLVKLEGEERTKLWNSIMLRSYPYIFDGSFPLQTATSRMLEDKFGQVASGDTVRKCLSFFLLAAKDAGVQLSPYIKAIKARRANGTKTRRSTTTSGESTPAVAPPPAGASHPHEHKMPPIEAQSSLLLWGLFQRLPKPGSVWSKAERDQWTNTLNNVLALEYKEQ